VYGLWAFAPALVALRARARAAAMASSDAGSRAEAGGGGGDGELSQPALVFVAIGAGALGNAVGGFLSLCAALPLRPARRPARGAAPRGGAGADDGSGGDGGGGGGGEAQAQEEAAATEAPGSAVVAMAALAASALCCALAPLSRRMGARTFAAYLGGWGFAAAADSAQLSALCAARAPRGLVGAALTLTTAIGFSVTICALQLLGEGRGMRACVCVCACVYVRVRCARVRVCACVCACVLCLCHSVGCARLLLPCAACDSSPGVPTSAHPPASRLRHSG
jgi:hypothetical protein